MPENAGRQLALAEGVIQETRRCYTRNLRFNPPLNAADTRDGGAVLPGFTITVDEVFSE
ncbi:MAG: hypothetical protein H6671_12080 [Anaerolineaceae bacterium]|nr:hypothetical protein [Anaerolineaceae bacterium]